VHRLERKDGRFAGEKGLPVALDLKQLTETGEFEGYGATFGNVDHGGDVCVAGCFAESLRRRPAQQVRMLFQHDTYEPIGTWLDIREDARGLAVRGRLLLTLNKGRETYEMLKAGIVDGLSIGYRTIRDEVDRDASGVRRILEAELREVSVVTFPMNEQATVTVVKGGVLPTVREYERMHLREGFSAKDAKALAGKYRSFLVERDAGGHDHHRTERDAGTGGEGLLEALQGLRRTIASA
jgi:HK97 family phage prohead protease